MKWTEQVVDMGKTRNAYLCGKPPLVTHRSTSEDNIKMEGE
jgi:hypothetical protein